ncbi:MAG: hypothetical protein BGO52_09750 [Sphingobacteriales bacterium 44-61]|nr:MAG: hypothetical protein BGO52_09750 [Sphingobacteriales bacterium 44-61]
MITDSSVGMKENYSPGFCRGFFMTAIKQKRVVETTRGDHMRKLLLVSNKSFFSYINKQTGIRHIYEAKLIALNTPASPFHLIQHILPLK